jgi:hypothetical protein
MKLESKREALRVGTKQCLMKATRVNSFFTPVTDFCIWLTSVLNLIDLTEDTHSSHTIVVQHSYRQLYSQLDQSHKRLPLPVISNCLFIFHFYSSRPNPSAIIVVETMNFVLQNSLNIPTSTSTYLDSSSQESKSVSILP